MAIIYSDRPVPVDDFVRGLRRAAAAVLRVWVPDPSGSMRGFCSAWLIAPGLVVIPGFAVGLGSSAPEAGPIRIRVAGAGRDDTPRESLADLEQLGTPRDAGADPMMSVALARIDPRSSDRILPLCFDLAHDRDLIAIVSYPEGRTHPAVSLGRITGEDGGFALYDAATLPGSSGAPVLEMGWRVIALHMGTGDRANRGLTRGALIDLLRQSQAWPEIARHHRIADDSRASEVLRQSAAPPDTSTADPVLLRAAVSPTVDRTSLSPEEQDRLRPLMASATSDMWTLRPQERQAILAGAGGLAALRVARGPSPATTVPQRVIDTILAGPPYPWPDADEDALAWWIQAVRWFEGVAPDLPTPRQVATRLERRRVRSRLDRIAGPSFRGRAQELARLRGWALAPGGPLVVTGVGGVGKSALVARFASEQTADTLLLWLDFDRADLAPDDAGSVLAAIAEQAAVQIDGFEKPGPATDDWADAARRLGARIAAAAGDQPPLLVLDSFEAAQYAERYQELWPVLESLCETLPQLRVLVTGRAPVPALILNNRIAEHLAVRGLASADARAWLTTMGVTHPAAVERVLDLADGIPLILRLAAEYIDRGGDANDLPRDLPPAIVAGYLYDRILDRVQDVELKPLARGALVLRRLTAEMIVPVLDGLVTLPPGEPADWIAALSREMALVEGDVALRLRPEVRAATLELLERDEPEFVREIDRRAAAWYAAQPHANPELAAELVYHRLRLGDLDGASAAWVDGAGAFLMFADEEVRGGEARTWLKTRLGMTAAQPASADVWEQGAAERVRQVRSRKHHRAAVEILKERGERTDASPLVFHDAYELRRQGRGADARALLERSGDPPGPIGRDRRTLLALVAAEAGDREVADALLASLIVRDAWTDRGPTTLIPIALEAARVRLATDLATEASRLEASAFTGPGSPDALAPVDVVLPALRQRLGTPLSLEYGAEIVDIEDERGRISLDARVDAERAQSLRGEPPPLRDRRRALAAAWTAGEPWLWSPGAPPDVRLAELGWRRWWLAARGRFAAEAASLCRNAQQTGAPLALAILGTLALYASRLGTLIVGAGGEPIERLLRQHPVAREPVRIPADRWPGVERILKVGFADQVDWFPARQTTEGDVILVTEQLIAQASGHGRDAAIAVLAVVAPDPLDQVVAALAGQTDAPA